MKKHKSITPDNETQRNIIAKICENEGRKETKRATNLLMVKIGLARGAVKNFFGGYKRGW